MNSLILSILVGLVTLFHLAVRTTVRKGKVREAFCAHWCIDAVFAVCGTVLIFMLYNYNILTFLTLRNILLALAYLMITLLLVLLAPSGLTLLIKRKNTTSETILPAEYRFNDTLCLIRNFFLAILFGIPILENPTICGAFYFTAFLILLPISLRQAFFWLKHLSDTPDEQETQIRNRYCMREHYRKRNLRL